MDSLKKLEEINSVNERLFGKVFGGKNAPQATLLTQNRQGNYFLNGNFVYSFGTDGTANPYIQETWLEDDLKWILEPDVKFDASYIYIRNRKLGFQGKWISGAFKGDIFEGTRSTFEGGTFEGNTFASPNDSFKTSPENFISGKFIDCKNGLLGSSNYTSPKEDMNAVSLVSVPVDWSIKIVGDGGKEINIKVLKKLDEVNSDFQLQTLSDLKKYSVTWQTIVSDYQEYGFIRRGGSFVLLGASYEIRNIESISLSEESPAVKVQNKEVLDFTQDAGLAPFFQGKIAINLGSQEDIDRAKNIQRSIKNGNLTKNLSVLKDLIQKKVVDGYGNEEWYYLKSLFNDVKGKDVTDERIKNIMKELNSVLELISFNSQIIKEAKASSAYSTLVSGLKKSLNINKFITPQQGQQKTSDVVDFSIDKNLSPYFSIGGNPVKFQVFTKSPDVLKNTAELQQKIADGSFFKDLNLIKHYIGTGDIDGYSEEKWGHLKPVFNKIKGKNTIFNKEVMDAMAVLNGAIGLLSFNSNILKESVSEVLNLLVEILKGFLEIDKYITSSPKETPGEVSDAEKSSATSAAFNKAL